VAFKAVDVQLHSRTTIKKEFLLCNFACKILRTEHFISMPCQIIVSGMIFMNLHMK
jgi:hypothetical protein